MSQPSDPEAEAPKEKTVWEKGASQYKNKRYSEYFDPCQEAADRSLRCLRRNGGDRSMCTDFFEAYKDCKRSWMEEMKEEKRKARRGWFSSS
ncbi:hypothetical protein K431DRAFT_280961 [Polychaeton citri CBS 116435]|uniref:Cytochrome c oxidase-assembly factor COX23, mitochondrial n=1 Tax=Polychaeton citri CBS 116435 TaxID=1314669 RepID=A0A9P4QIY6_9PEZI|nr:hypothetical protein K431DRAFT_280961 [Polychaeton citri CBS 116435]